MLNMEPYLSLYHFPLEIAFLIDHHNYVSYSIVPVSYDFIYVPPPRPSFV